MKLFTFLFSTILLSFFATPPADAQFYRAGQSFYVTLNGGMGYQQTDVVPNGIEPFVAGGGLGFQFSQGFGLGLHYNFGKYKGINGDDADASTVRQHLQMRLKWSMVPKFRLTPYLLVGGHAVVNDKFDFANVGFGPTGGFGLDVAVSDRVGLFLEGNVNFTTPDKTLDNQVGAFPFDILGAVTAGVRISFSKPFVPVHISDLTGPDTLLIGEPGIFIPILKKATEPVTHTWEFGDGDVSNGFRVSHAFRAAGTYTITFTANNRKSTHFITRQVEVIDPCPDPVQIVSLTASAINIMAGEQIQFNAEIVGSPTISHLWNFGDGTSASAQAPAHTYNDSGTYTVTVEANNCKAPDRKTIVITVLPAPIVVEACNPEELETVHFAVGRSTIDVDGEEALLRNLEKLQRCRDLCVRILSYTDPNGTVRINQKLAADRANAVQQFYIRNGIAASRLVKKAVGQVAGGRSSRRVESIAVDCSELE